MYDPTTGDRVTKVIVPDFPMDDIEGWVFGPETPKVIVVSRTWKESDFSISGDTITVQASHIYKNIEDLKIVDTKIFSKFNSSSVFSPLLL